jgi:uncharacterized repeat protein (TIGR03803 family)
MMQGTSFWQFVIRPTLALSVIVAAITLTLLTAPVARAQTLTTLYDFCTRITCRSGDSPLSLIQATDGNFYGTATKGGANDNGYCADHINAVHGCGTVFKITPSGTLTTLYSFCREPNCTDGALPQAAMIQATNGDFYGTTSFGGANGGGTVFKITSTGKLTTLYNFCSQPNCADGSLPQTALMQARNGDFYGTTAWGGTGENVGCSTTKNAGCGTVFRLTPAGNLTTLYSFCAQPNCADGAVPGAPLIQATNGDFYGTTEQGGAHIQTPGGTIFKISPGGDLTILYDFCSQPNCTDGAVPIAPLIQAANENLYGTTSGNFGTTDPGTVFEITPSGRLTTLYNFANGGTNGGTDPEGALIQATNGDFYGTTVSGGTSGLGTAFALTPGGILTTLYSFCSADETCTDGAGPFAALLQATSGEFYGTTTSGQYGHGGTIFSLNVGLGSFVALQTSTGEVGAKVTILGTNLTGTTSVTFNGTAAMFNVNSTGSAITTSVPTGATTGSVQVVMPNGTLQSNVVYRVEQAPP